MPIYEFVCTECGHHFDVRMSLASMGGKLYIMRCPECKRVVEVKRVWTPPTIVIKKVRGYE